MKNVLIVSFHEWQSFRYGGFHAIGECFIERGCKVLFATSRFSISEKFKTDYLWQNFKNVCSLNRGLVINTKYGNLVNVGCLGLWEQSVLSKRFPSFVSKLISRLQKKYFIHQIDKFEKDFDLIVIESGGALIIFNELKRKYKNAKFIYRPSDLCASKKNPSRELLNLEKMVIFSSDLVVFVNVVGVEIARSYYGDIISEKFEVIPNGYQKTELIEKKNWPDNIAQKKFAVYVGGHSPMWEALICLSEKMKEIQVVVITPARPPGEFLNALGSHNNLVYIPGVPPSGIGAYLQNSSVVLAPYYPDKRDLLVHGKILQAMFLKKPIVCLNVHSSLKDYGVQVAGTIGEFIELVEGAMITPEVNYKFDFDYDWNSFKNKFYDCASSLF